GLRQVADAAPNLERFREDVEAGDARRAGRGADVAGENAHGRRFAGSVRAQEPQYLAGWDRERHVLDGRPLAVVLGEALDFDQVREFSQYVRSKGSRPPVAAIQSASTRMTFAARGPWRTAFSSCSSTGRSPSASSSTAPSDR